MQKQKEKKHYFPFLVMKRHCKGGVFLRVIERVCDFRGRSDIGRRGKWKGKRRIYFRWVKEGRILHRWGGTSGNGRVCIIKGGRLDPFPGNNAIDDEGNSELEMMSIWTIWRWEFHGIKIFPNDKNRFWDRRLIQLLTYIIFHQIVPIRSRPDQIG